MEAVLAICDPDVELTPGGLWLDDASVCRGRAFNEPDDAFAAL